MVVCVLAGPLRSSTTLGSHDWDQMEAHRYLIFKSMRRFGQFPFWDPYGCGGHPSWAGIESGTAIVSPFLPAYLFLPLAVALRLELLVVTLWSAVGTWLFARRCGPSPGAALFACAVFVVNTRWAFQVSAGHTWHLYYALFPWCLWAFDGACERPVDGGGGRYGHWRPTVYLALSFAMMVYTGAIYPLPQAALLLLCIALVRAWGERSLRPLIVLATAGGLGVMLAAPKLLPIVDTMRRYPRLVESPEVVELGALIRLLTETQAELARVPLHFSHWGFHEYGMYIGGPISALVLLVACVFAPRNARTRALLWTGLLAMLLGLGSFHPQAPWPLLRTLPVFRSQHVPSRWMYPGVLLLAGVCSSTMSVVRRKAARVAVILECVLCVAAVLAGVRVVLEAEPIMRESFTAPPLAVRESNIGYYQEARVTPELQYSKPDYGPSALPQRVANIGTIECITFPGLNGWAPHDASGRVQFQGARGRGESDYRGEAFLASGAGLVTMTRWTPNEVQLELSRANPGDALVLNQNWDESWTANGVPTQNYSWTNSYVVKQPNERVTFRYRPRTFSLGLGCAMAALLFMVWVERKNFLNRARARARGATASAGVASA
jgi:hypothetical protein